MFTKVFKLVFIAVFLSLQFAIPSWADKEGWPQEIRVGLCPTMGRTVVDYFQPLINHLKKELGTEVNAYSADDYAGIIQAIAYDQVHFARLGPNSYIEAKEMADADPLVSEVNKHGEAGYYGSVIAKKGSGIESIEQAKGRIFAFTDPNSTSGYLIPSVMLARKFNIDPKTYFKEVRFSGSHRNSVLAVNEGTVEVAAISTSHIYRLEDEGKVSRDDFVFLWKSELIPSDPFCARKDLPESLKNAFRDAMLRFGENKEGLEKMQISGYCAVNDKTYDIIREIRQLKKELAKKE
jgi:phosphonate transport system substrate-binding protein